MTITVGIALSGGVDSALAALSLQRQGFNVRAYTMLLMPEDDSACRKAADVAAKLNIPHKILDFKNEFKKNILDYFISEYAMGNTPSPCIRCNRKIKFGLLMDAMKADGCDKFATGHYAQSRQLPEENLWGLFRGAEPNKDQSYFLGQLSQAQLSSVIFPIGLRSDKEEIKREADALGLIPKEQPESQDLCFLPDGKFAEFISARRPDLLHHGKIIELESGKSLGTHQGAFAYTIGQRRGLGLGGGPWYVTGTDIQENKVFISKSPSQITSLSLDDVNWLSIPPPIGQSIHVQVQLRFRMSPRPANLTNLGNGRISISFPVPAPAVPNGQLAAVYTDNRLICAALIY